MAVLKSRPAVRYRAQMRASSRHNFGALYPPCIIAPCFPHPAALGQTTGLGEPTRLIIRLAALGVVAWWLLRTSERLNSLEQRQETLWLREMYPPVEEDDD